DIAAVARIHPAPEQGPEQHIGGGEGNALQQAHLGIAEQQVALYRVHQQIENLAVDEGEHIGEGEKQQPLPGVKAVQGQASLARLGHAALPRRPGHQPCPASCWRSLNFWILVADMGHSVTNITSRGTLKLASLPLQKSISSRPLADCPGISSTKATATSP